MMGGLGGVQPYYKELKVPFQLLMVEAKVLMFRCSAPC